MDVNLTHLHGPDGSSGDERCELVVRTAHGFEVRIQVWADAVSAPWVTVEEITPEGERIDLFQAAQDAGRALQRAQPAAFTPLQDVDTSQPFEPVAELDQRAYRQLQRCGATFEREREFDAPGPTRWAAVQLADGSPFLLTVHVDHEPAFIELRAPRTGRAPSELVAAFTAAAGLDDEQVTWVADGWPTGTADERR